MSDLSEKLGPGEMGERWRAEQALAASIPASGDQQQFAHYYRSVAGLKTIDIYRVLQLFGIEDPCIQHAVKKLMVAGARGHKDAAKDVAEAIISLRRWQAMRAEERSLR